MVNHNTTGIIVPPKDAHALAMAIKDLAGDRERVQRLAQRAHDFVVPEFSLENMVYHIESLYELLLKEKNLDPGR